MYKFPVWGLWMQAKLSRRKTKKWPSVAELGIVRRFLMILSRAFHLHLGDRYLFHLDMCPVDCSMAMYKNLSIRRTTTCIWHSVAELGKQGFKGISFTSRWRPCLERPDEAYIDVATDKKGYSHTIFFLFLNETICCGYSLEAPRHNIFLVEK